ncbi:MAG TPA: hypothetical protein PKM72_07765 [Nitrospirales bacterium]|nr:hypothetical protein [Nitrospirales bacterium]
MPGNRIGVDAAVAQVAGAGIGGSGYTDQKQRCGQFVIFGDG